MSRKTLPKENFFLLKEKNIPCIVQNMDSPKQIYDRFYAALKKKESEYGSGFNKFVSGEAGISTGFMSLILSGKKKASQKNQILICSACGFDYKTFFSEDSHQEPETKKQEDADLLEKLELYRDLLEMKNREIANLKAEIRGKAAETDGSRSHVG